MTVSRHVTPLAVAGVIIGGCFLIVRSLVPSSIDGATETSEATSEESPTDEIVWFQSKDGKFGLRNGRGDIVLKPTYDGARPFSEGLAAVNIGGTTSQFEFRGKELTTTDGGKWGYANSVGKLVIPARYENPDRFREGVASISTSTINMKRENRGKVPPVVLPHRIHQLEGGDTILYRRSCGAVS